MRSAFIAGDGRLIESGSADLRGFRPLIVVCAPRRLASNRCRPTASPDGRFRHARFSPARASPPRAFGRYELRQLLGKSAGTMAWLAFDPRLRRR